MSAAAWESRNPNRKPAPRPNERAVPQQRATGEGIDLAGRVALVTSSSRGIARACALRLAEAGADVAVNYVISRFTAEDVAAEIQQLGRRAAVMKADVSEQDDVISIMEFIKEHFDGLDIMVSNAATGGFRHLFATDARHFEAAMNTNVRALLFLMQVAMPMLDRTEGRAKVIALSSHGPHRAQPMYGLIGSTKAALESLVRHFAMDVGGRGVNLNIVKAGLVQTESFKQLRQAWAGALGPQVILAQDPGSSLREGRGRRA